MSLAAEPLDALGWDEHWALLLAASGVPNPIPARVVRAHKGGLLLQTPDGPSTAQTRSRALDPATGDWIAAVTDPAAEGLVVEAVLPRAHAIVRRDAAERSRPQVLAANVDTVVVTWPLDRPLNARALERFLAVAHGSGAPVALVLTKADASEDLAGACAQARAIAPSASVHAVTRNDPATLRPLLELVDGHRTVGLVGTSGAGKSTLVNGLVGSELLPTGEVRSGDAKGRHTTTVRSLVPHPGGGAWIDTPGLRAVGLWPASTDLEATFAEIAEAATQCRFADCAHSNEPDCAVQAAIAEGAIDAARLDAYQTLWREVDAEARTY